MGGMAVKAGKAVFGKLGKGAGKGAKAGKAGEKLAKTGKQAAKAKKAAAELAKKQSKLKSFLKKAFGFGALGALGASFLSGNSAQSKNKPANAKGINGRGKNFRGSASAANKDFINDLLGRKRTKESPKFINYVFRHSENTKKGIEEAISSDIRDELAEMNQRIYAELYNMKYPAQFKHISENITSEYISKIVDIQKKLDYKAQEEHFSSENLLKLVEVQSQMRDVLGKIHEDMIDEQVTTIQKEPTIIINEVQDDSSGKTAAVLGLNNMNATSALATMLGVLAGTVISGFTEISNMISGLYDDFMDDAFDGDEEKKEKFEDIALKTGINVLDHTALFGAVGQSVKAGVKASVARFKTAGNSGAAKAEAKVDPAKVSAEMDKKVAEQLPKSLDKNTTKLFGKKYAAEVSSALGKIASKALGPVSIVLEYFDAVKEVWDHMHGDAEKGIERCDEMLEELQKEPDSKERIIKQYQVRYAKIVLREDYSPNFFERIFAGLATYGESLIQTGMELGALIQGAKGMMTGDMRDYELIADAIAEEQEEFIEHKNSLYHLPLPDEYDPENPITILTKKQLEEASEKIINELNEFTRFGVQMFDYKVRESDRGDPQKFFTERQNLVRSGYGQQYSTEIFDEQLKARRQYIELLAMYYGYLCDIIRGNLDSAKGAKKKHKGDAISSAMKSSDLFSTVWGNLDNFAENPNLYKLLRLCLVVYFKDVAFNDSSVIKEADEAMKRFASSTHKSHYITYPEVMMYPAGKIKMFYEDMLHYYNVFMGLDPNKAAIYAIKAEVEDDIIKLFLRYYEILKNCDNDFTFFLNKEKMITLDMPNETKVPDQGFGDSSGSAPGSGNPQETDAGKPTAPGMNVDGLIEKPSEKEPIIPEKPEKQSEKPKAQGSKFIPKNVDKDGTKIPIGQIVVTKNKNVSTPGKVAFNSNYDREFVSALNGGHESGNNPGAINPNDTNGTLSLGLHQINAAKKDNSAFFQFLMYCKNSGDSFGLHVFKSFQNYTDWRKIYSGDGKAQVQKIWRDLAKENPKAFADIQNGYIFKLYYDDPYKKFNENVQKAVNANDVMKQVALSATVHMGPGGGTKVLNSTYNDDYVTWINNVYYKRMSIARNQYFKAIELNDPSKMDPNLYKSQLRNLESERQEALHNLEQLGIEVPHDKFVTQDVIEPENNDKKEEHSEVIIENAPQKSINPIRETSSDTMFIIPFAESSEIWI